MNIIYIKSFVEFYDATTYLENSFEEAILEGYLPDDLRGEVRYVNHQWRASVISDTQMEFDFNENE